MKFTFKNLFTDFALIRSEYETKISVFFACMYLFDNIPKSPNFHERKEFE